MSAASLPGPEACACMETLFPMIEALKPLLAECSIEDNHIAEALRGLAEWYDPDPETRLYLVTGDGEIFPVSGQVQAPIVTRKAS